MVNYQWSMDYRLWTKDYVLKTKDYLLLIILITLGFSATGQEFKKQYKAAKEFYEDKQYNFAMDAFKPLMVYDRSNSYTEYSSFYYALSAYHQNYFAVAKESLLQLKNLYPNWEQQDEVNYWLAAIYFKQGEHFQALRMLYDMKSPRDLASMERLKNYFLMQVYDEQVIRLLLEEFPGEAALLKRLIIRKIVKGEYDKGRELISLNGLDESDFNFPKQNKVLVKDSYRVAALFPFLSETLEPSPGQKRNQSTLDLYIGMKLALDSLSKLGVNIELTGYDTERNAETVSKIVALDEMKSTDIIFGPLFTDELSEVTEFSKANNIPVINPVSNSSDFIGDNSNALLLQPDYAAIGAAGAEALAARHLKKPCVVLYGESVKDSVLAFSFQQRASELNLKIVLTKKILKTNSASVYSTLANPVKFDRFRNPIEFTIKRDSIGSVYVASDDELIFTKVISSVDRRADSVIVVGLDTWLDKPSMDFDKFERLHIMMAAPSFVSVLTTEYQSFVKKYASNYGVLPSSYARIGFESMLMVGKSLKENGLSFISKAREAYSIEGSFGRIYKFNKKQSNQEVPFVIFDLGELRALY